MFTSLSGGLILRRPSRSWSSRRPTRPGSRPTSGLTPAAWVVTTLFVHGDVALEDIARFVGHARLSTTAGYVKRLGHRPSAGGHAAAGIPDAQALGLAATGRTRVRNHPPILGAIRCASGERCRGRRPCSDNSLTSVADTMRCIGAAVPG